MRTKFIELDYLSEEERIFGKCIQCYTLNNIYLGEVKIWFDDFGISGLEVEKQYRGKGIASKLMTELIRQYKCQQLYLFAIPYTHQGMKTICPFKELVAFYKRFGFRVLKYDLYSTITKKPVSALMIRKANKD